MGTLLQDLRYAVRMLMKRPGFTTVAIVALALGVGANTAIFSLVNSVLVRPLPVERPQEVVSLALFGKDDSMQAFSYPAYVDFRDRNEVLSGLYATRFALMSLSRGGNNDLIWGYLVSGNYFDVLGVRAALGRTFAPEEDRTRLTHPVAVLSYGSWQRRFGGDPGVIGQDVVLNGHKFQIIGVAPEGFQGTEVIYAPELWVPMMMQEWIEPNNPWLDQRLTHNLFVGGRLKPDVSNERAEAALNLLAQQLGREYPDSDEGIQVRVTAPGFILPTVRGAVVSFAVVLMATMGLVLLIACANLANLLLARATERRREIAIRLAMGASRGRLVRQLLTESVLLSLAGGLLGLLLAYWIIDMAGLFKPPLFLPLWIDLYIDWRVLVYAVAISLATGVVFGLVPALQATNPDLVPALKEASSQAGYRRSRLRNGLIVAQVALSLVLLIAAGLVVRALVHVQGANPGFKVENGLIMSFDLSLQGYDRARGEQFQRQLLERLRALPGVSDASLTDLFPLSLNYSTNNVFVEGQPPARGANVPAAMVASVEAAYFSTMSIPLVAGRGFASTDDADAPRVIIVNETFARRFFPGDDPAERALGKRVAFTTPDAKPWQIVGVARDGKYWTIGEAPQMFVYLPLSQSYTPSTTLVVRTEGDPEAMIGAIRETVRGLDDQVPLYGVNTIEKHIGVSLFPARVAAALLGAFGALALVLAAIGIYGVMSHAVAQRTREIGIRMALGAEPRAMLKMIAGWAMLLAGVGVAIGLGAALLLMRFMESLLYGVSAADPLTYALIVLLLLGVALAACLAPALRAMRVDPMEALRYE